MRPLTSHFAVPALTTLDPRLKQAQAARVFRRAQAVRAVVAGHQIAPVAATFHVAKAALRTWGQRLAQEGPQGWRDRARSGRPPNSTCALAQPRKRLVDPDPLPPGAVSSPWSGRALATVFARATGGQRSRARGRRVLKNRPKRLAPHRAPGSCPRCPRVGLGRPRGSRIARPSRCAHCALCRGDDPVALGAAPRGLVAHRPAGSPPHTPPEPASDATRGVPPTARVGAVSLLGPCLQRRVAPCHGGRPVWDLQRLLENRAAL
jgi:transposase